VRGAQDPKLPVTGEYVTGTFLTKILSPRKSLEIKGARHASHGCIKRARGSSREIIEAITQGTKPAKGPWARSADPIHQLGGDPRAGLRGVKYGIKARRTRNTE